MKFGSPHMYTGFFNKILRARVHVISKAKIGLIHSIFEVFDIFKRFSGVGFNYPANKNISD